MWVCIVPRPAVPEYCIHQHLWGYFPEVQKGEPRPFVFRAARKDILMLSRLKPAAPALRIADRIQAGRVYQFETLVDGRRTNRHPETGRCVDKPVLGNADRQAWFASKMAGADIRFMQIFDRPVFRLKKGNGQTVTSYPFAVRGMLHVLDRAVFVERLLIGPGRGKCWGFGLVVLPEVMGDVLRRAA